MSGSRVDNVKLIQESPIDNSDDHIVEIDEPALYTPEKYEHFFKLGIKPALIAVMMLLLTSVAYDRGLKKGFSNAIMGDEAKRSDLIVQHSGMSGTKNSFNGIQTQENEEGFQGLDIYVIGFPKTGTGSLRDFFEESEEVAMLGRENKDLCDGTPEHALAELDEDFTGVDNFNVPIALRAVKTPGVIQNVTSIQRLAKYTKRDTKLILGVRHPVMWFQSKFNHRVWNLCKDGCNSSKVPHPASLVGGPDQSWRNVYTELARFEMYMKQLGKSELSPNEFIEMGNWDLDLAPNKYKVFLYATEQLGDENEERAELFKSDFQSYLGLKNPVGEWPQNKVFRERYPEEIDICESDYKSLRDHLVVQGKATAAWIRDEFITSPDVIVGGNEYFMQLLDLWGKDICQIENQTL